MDQVGRHARRGTQGGGSHDGQFFRFLGVGFTQVDELEFGAREDLHGCLGLESRNEFCLRFAERNGGTCDARDLKLHSVCIESDRL